MLTIRPKQMRAFDDDLVLRFAAGLADELLRTEPQAVSGLRRPEIIPLCADAIRTGRACGLSDRADLHAFVVLTFLIGTEFHGYEPIRQILRDTAVPDGKKMAVIMDAIVAALTSGPDSHAEEECGTWQMVDTD